MPTDRYGIGQDTVSSPSLAPVALTPSDSVELAVIPKGLWIGTGGDVTLRAVNGGVDVVFKAVPSGHILPVRARFVRATGTTATDIVAL